DPRSGGSNGVEAKFTRSDPDRFLDVGNEDLSVADPSGLGGAADRLDGLFDHVVAEDNLDLHLGQKVYDILSTAIELGVALLAAETLGLGDGDALQADVLQRLFHLVEFEWFDDGLDLLHLAQISGPVPRVSDKPDCR